MNRILSIITILSLGAGLTPTSAQTPRRVQHPYGSQITRSYGQELPRGGIEAFATAAEAASALQAAHARNTTVDPAEEVAEQKAPKSKSGKISRAALKSGSTIAVKADDKSSSAQNGNHRYLTRLDDWAQNGKSFTTEFSVPFAWVNRQVLLHLGSASSSYKVRVNGREAALCNDGNQAAEYNITKLTRDGRNTIEVELTDNQELEQMEGWRTSRQPSLGQAWVMSQPTLRIRDVEVKTWMADSPDHSATAEVAIIVKSSALNPRSSRIHYALLSPSGEEVANGTRDITLEMRGEDTLRFVSRIPQSFLWSPRTPMFYTLRLRTQHEGRFMEYIDLGIGFRALNFDQGAMSLNGAPVTLKMCEIDPSADDRELLRLSSNGYNTFKLKAGTVRHGLYEFCDKMGFFVIAQAPIDTHLQGDDRTREGNISNDPYFRSEFIERAVNNYHHTKRHPSVIGFSMADHSANGINLYDTYLTLKSLNDIRPMIYLDAAGEWNSDKLVMEGSR